MRKILVIVLLLVTIISAGAMKFDDLVELARADDFSGFKSVFNRNYSVRERNEFGSTPLLWISGLADPKYAEFLISKGASIHDKIETEEEYGEMKDFDALMIAAWGNNADLVQYYLDLGADPNYKTYSSNTAMDYACMEGNYDVVELLLPYMDNISVSGAYSHLMWAVSYDNWGVEKVVDILLDAGVDINADEDWSGYTLTHDLAMTENPALFAKFMNRNVNWEKHTQWGATPIFMAVSSSISITKYLLDQGVTLDLVESYNGYTPLHDAVDAGNPYTVQLLMDAGAPLSRKSRDGQTPLELARELGNQQIVSILEGKERVALPDISIEDEIELGFFVNFSEFNDIELTDLNGNKKNISDYKGNVLLYNIWATWCGPCREEMPSMQNLYEDYKSKGFTILAESIDEYAGEAESFAKGLDLTFPIFHFQDNSGREMWGPYPRTYIIAANGTLVSEITGSRDWNTPEMRAFIEKLISMNNPDAIDAPYDGGGSRYRDDPVLFNDENEAETYGESGDYWSGDWNIWWDDDGPYTMDIQLFRGKLRGSYDYNDGILRNMTSEGISLQGEWIEDGNEGWFEFKLSPDKNKFTGQWGFEGESSAAGTWDGTRQRAPGSGFSRTGASN